MQLENTVGNKRAFLHGCCELGWHNTPWLLPEPFVDDATLGGAVGCIKGREALQRDLDKLEGWEITNSMKFIKTNCEILHLGRRNLDMHRLGDKRLESTGRDLGILVNDKLNVS